MTQGKVFIGGLSQETDNESLKNYFSKYGCIVDSVVMFDNVTKRSRGFGFVTFDSPKCVDAVLSEKHKIDNKLVECKRACPKESYSSEYNDNLYNNRRSYLNSDDMINNRNSTSARYLRTEKIFVGGLPDITTDDFKKYFSKFGQVIDAVVMNNKSSGRPRGFGFITYKNADSVDEVLKEPNKHYLNDKLVEVKRALPRDATYFNGKNFNGGMFVDSRSRSSYGPGPYMLDSRGPPFCPNGMDGRYGPYRNQCNDFRQGAPWPPDCNYDGRTDVYDCHVYDDHMNYNRGPGGMIDGRNPYHGGRATGYADDFVPNGPNHRSMGGYRGSNGSPMMGMGMMGGDGGGGGMGPMRVPLSGGGCVGGPPYGCNDRLGGSVGFRKGLGEAEIGCWGPAPVGNVSNGFYGNPGGAGMGSYGEVDGAPSGRCILRHGGNGASVGYGMNGNGGLVGGGGLELGLGGNPDSLVGSTGTLNDDSGALYNPIFGTRDLPYPGSVQSNNPDITSSSAPGCSSPQSASPSAYYCPQNARYSDQKNSKAFTQFRPHRGPASKTTHGNRANPY